MGTGSHEPSDRKAKHDETIVSDGSRPAGKTNSDRSGDTQIDGIRDGKEIPKAIGRFKILDLLGRGGMGAVYLAFDEKLDRKVAIKVPEFSSSQSKNTLIRFYREAKSAAKLSHPNLCQVYDVGEVSGQHYIAMAYIQGHTLSRYIDSSRKNDPKLAAMIVRKVAKAMEEAHGSGVIHRDLKPSNIMLDNRREPIVMDFGLAYPKEDGDEESRLTQHGAILGSPAYMAPEQLKGETDKIGRVSDVYSLGVVFYELLCGEIPYPGTGSTIALISRVLTEEPVPLSTTRPDIDPRVVKICEKAMHKDVAHRYQTMKEFSDAIGRYLKDIEVAAKAEGSKRIKIDEEIECARKLCESKQYTAALSLIEEVGELTRGIDEKLHKWSKQQVAWLKDKIHESEESNPSLPTDGKDLFGDFLDLKKDPLTNSPNSLKYSYDRRDANFWTRMTPRQRKQFIVSTATGIAAVIGLIIALIFLAI